MNTFTNGGFVEFDGNRLCFQFRVVQVVESAFIVLTQFSTDGENRGGEAGYVAGRDSLSAQDEAELEGRLGERWISMTR
jgi:hypothetical protein